MKGKGMSSFQASDERKKSNLFGCQLIWVGFIFLAVNEPLFYILETESNIRRSFCKQFESVESVLSLIIFRLMRRKTFAEKAIIKLELYVFSAVLQTITESCQKIWGRDIS